MYRSPEIIIIEIESLKEHNLFAVQGMMTDNDFRFMANTVAGMLLSAQVMKPCNPSAEKGQTETFKEDAMFRYVILYWLAMLIKHSLVALIVLSERQQGIFHRPSSNIHVEVEWQFDPSSF